MSETPTGPACAGDLPKRPAEQSISNWPAFYKSFVRLAEMIARVASHANGPTTVSVLSGDVHHSYAARAEWAVDSAQSPGAAVHQLVCSPVNNYVPLFLKPVFTLSWS